MSKATQATGKEGELRVIGELLRRGFDIYLPLVDIGGVDCIIKTDVDYKEIQIKTREKFSYKLLFDVKNFVPRDNSLLSAITSMSRIYFGLFLQRFLRTTQFIWKQ